MLARVNVVRFTFESEAPVDITIADAEWLADELRTWSNDPTGDRFSAALVFVHRALEDAKDEPNLPLTDEETGAILEVLDKNFEDLTETLQGLRHAIADKLDRDG